MLNKGTINYRAVIEKMARDTGFTQYFEDECKEWLWEAISLIGVSSLFVNVEEEITIEEYRGLLPVNLESIIGVKDYHTNNPIIEDLGVYSKTYPDAEGTAVTRVISDGVSYTSVDGTIIPDLSHVYVDIVKPIVSSRGAYRYQVKGHYIYIDGIRNGKIVISYYSFPVEDNAPVIPNDAKMLEFCSWYIATKIAMRLMIKGEISQGIKNEIEQQYLFYASSARIKALTPDIQMMEAMKRRLGIVPDVSRYDLGFTNY